MPHAIILGVSGCGKTTLAKQLAGRMQRVAVCEFGGSKRVGKTNWGKPAFHTMDIDSLLYFAQHNIRCNIFIDDAGDNMRRSKDFDFFTTCGRRWGHTVFLITQRANQLTPNIRTNCETIYCFRQSDYDVELLLQDFPTDFNKAKTLPKYEFLAQRDRFSPVTQHKVVA